MFIKFGDKTKPVVVKPGKKPNQGSGDDSGDDGVSVIYLDSKSKLDRRLAVLNGSDSIESPEDKEEDC
tara:strand:+ start:83766 stop:83969 length:204 start_codon:yes stop_codon:yes gene_type:complete